MISEFATTKIIILVKFSNYELTLNTRYWKPSKKFIIRHSAPLMRHI